MEPHAHAEVERGRAGADKKPVRPRSPGELRAHLLPQLSHELRVQLQAIAASSAALRRLDESDGLLRDASSILDRSARALNQLLDDLVDLVSAEQGTLALDRVPTPVHVLVARALATIGETIASKRLRVASCSPSPVVMVDCDPDRAQRLLTHVLRHAVENTSIGGSLTVRCVSARDHVRIEVASAPAGIAEIVAPILLEPAQRFRPTTSDLLGLDLAHALGAALGGALSVEQLGEHRTRISLTLARA